MAIRRLKKFRIEETGEGEIEAEGQTEEGEICVVRLAKSGKNKFRTVSRQGDDDACREVVNRVKRELSR